MVRCGNEGGRRGVVLLQNLVQMASVRRTGTSMGAEWHVVCQDYCSG